MSDLPVIKIQKLSKFYGNVRGVENISLEVFKGEIFGFLGPNGAGKTTTIRLLLDLLRPDSGVIEVLGKRLSENSVWIRSRCGYLPGNFSAYGNLSGQEFLALCADLRKTSMSNNRELYDRFELSESTLKQKIRSLSHGTLQKLGIVQAFFHTPELLILDEPTIGLDPLMQEAFYRLLEERVAKGSTVFLSSHNLAEVEKNCHRMAIIRKGKIEQTDSIENLRKIVNQLLVFILSKPIENIELPGASLIRRQGNEWEFMIQGEIAPILKKLSELPIERLVLPEPSLEEIFINFYKEKGND